MTTVERRPVCEHTPQKIKYLSAHDARTSRAARKAPLRCYRCDSCGYHHLTSQRVKDQ
jgi:hypothetical protein